MRRIERVLLGALMAAVAFVARAPAQVWEVDNILKTQSPPSAGAVFGAAVAVGDFDGDHHPDLVVGAHLWSSSQGSVTFYRGGGGLRTLDFLQEVHGTGVEQYGVALAMGDFDGDGKDEVAIGVPKGLVDYNGGSVQAGYVVIAQFESGCQCLTAAPVSPLSQLDTIGFSVPEAGDLFGFALATGDFNDDGYADLAVGVPGQVVSNKAQAGVVQVFYGSVTGLRTDTAQGFKAGKSGVLGTPGVNDTMGYALATGDFDKDGYDDLAIAAPARTVGAAASAGEVHILRGSAASGLQTVTGQQLLSEASFGGTAETNDTFGAALASGDFIHDRGSCNLGLVKCYADLAIGVPGKTLGGHAQAGEVVVGYGGAAGVSGSAATVLTQSGNGDSPEAGDQFGFSLAAGDIDSAFTDLAVGVPGESLQLGLQSDGLVQLFFGAPGGLNSGAPVQTLPQKAGFQIAPAASFDGWGTALAIADFDGDGAGDLVVSAPGKTVAANATAGAVEVLFGAMFADGFQSGTTAGWSVTSP